MIIGHYTPNLWEIGGIAQYIHRLSQRQQAAGHQVVFMDLQSAVTPEQRRADTLYCANDADVYEAARKHGIEILHVHRDFALPREMTIPVVRTIHTHSPYCPSGGRYLAKSDRPCPRTYGLARCLWGHAVDRCGSVRPAKLLENFGTTWRERRRLRRIVSLVSSQFVFKEMVRAGYDEAQLRLVVLPAPTVVEQPSPATESQRFVFMGRLAPQKGLAWLLRNLAMLDDTVRLDVAGDGNERTAMKALAEHLGLSARVTFHGWIGTEQTQRLLDDALALIVPSRWHEPFGLVSLEAMARGRAVIASNTGALPEVVVNHETGVIVPTGETDGLSKAMKQLIDNPALAGEMGTTGWRLARDRYSMDLHLNRITEIYQQCIGS